MIEIEITRLIAAAIAAVLLGWACYVTAFVKHKNAVKDETNKSRLEEKRAELYEDEEIRLEKSQTWYIGYRLALVGLILVAAAVGWIAITSPPFRLRYHRSEHVPDCRLQRS